MVTNLAVVRLEDRGSKLVSKYRESLEAYIGRPIIIRAAHNCTFSKRSLCDKLHPSQTTEAYSNAGLIRAVCILKRVYFLFLAGLC